MKDFSFSVQTFYLSIWIPIMSFFPQKCFAQPILPIPPSPQKVIFEPLKPRCKLGVNVTFLGDIYLLSQGAQASTAMFENVKPLLSWADFNVANFEGVVSSSNKRAWPDLPFALKMAINTPQVLSSVGIKYVTRANNHTMDFGEVGLNDTSKSLVAAGIHFAGSGKNLNEALKPITLGKNGIKIAILSVTTTLPQGAWATEKISGVAYPWTKSLREAIEAVKKTHDFVVVEFHWGQELRAALRPHQLELAHIALENGVDLVLGHHAHIAQAIEKINGKTIAYGLGNFLFTSFSESAHFGLAAHSSFCKGSPDTNGKSEKNSVQTVFTPLNTNNRVTAFKTKPYELPEFLKIAKTYQDSGAFPLDTQIFIPTENKTQTLANWLQF